MDENIKPNSLQAWVLAARPKTLTAASIPVMIGCALAEAHGHFQLVPAILCFLFAFLMQIDANFINDLYDFLKGSDREDRLGPERACAQGWITPKEMKRGILLTTLLAGICGLGLLFYSGWEMIPVGVACILFAYLYTKLAYQGASLASGLVIDTLLMVNNFRDREQDKISGKRTLVVRFGAKTGLITYFFLGFAACWCCFYFLGQGKLYASLLPQIYLLLHILTTARMARIGKGKALNIILGETSRNMFLFGLLLSIGLVI